MQAHTCIGMSSRDKMASHKRRSPCKPLRACRSSFTAVSPNNSAKQVLTETPKALNPATLQHHKGIMVTVGRLGCLFVCVQRRRPRACTKTSMRATCRPTCNGVAEDEVRQHGVANKNQAKHEAKVEQVGAGVRQRAGYHAQARLKVHQLQHARDEHEQVDARQGRVPCKFVGQRLQEMG